MSIEHNNITDPNIHEPKGCSTASTGQVYLSDGAGSGTWTTPLWNAPVYCEIDRPASVVSLTGSTDVLISNFAFDDVEATKFTLTSGNRLTVLESGLYTVNLSVTITPTTAIGASNEVVTALLKINGLVPPAGRTLPITVIRNSATTDPFNVTTNRVIDLQAGDYFELYLNNGAATRSYSIISNLNLFKFGNL